MQSEAKNVDQYLDEVPEERQIAMRTLREMLLKQLIPLGFEEEMSSGMIGYVVPYSLYPSGYHCKPKQPLPFMALASQKHFIAIYHLGLYSDPVLLKWFEETYGLHTQAKLDMGKSCIRFKKGSDIPFRLLEELATKISASQWIATYEQSRRDHKRGI